MTDLSDAEKGLGQHIVAHALESDYDSLVDDDVDWSYRGWTIESVDTDDEWYEVHATQQSTQSELVARSTRWQPAEYKNHDVTLHLVARVTWLDEDPLMGDVEACIEQEGGRPLPPDPEPYDI